MSPSALTKIAQNIIIKTDNSLKYTHEQVESKPNALPITSTLDHK